jgi:diadenosine tetraphosphate (Ap4A) HIT family hydrolase
MDCPICARQSEPAIFADELVRVEHCPPEEGERDAYLGRLLVEPRRHAPALGDLTDDEARAIGLWVARMSRALRAAGAEHVYSLVLGHQVPHLHFHVIPRYPGTPKDYWGLRVLEWPAAPRGGPAEVAAFCARLKV